jgi:hypothetical protein
MALRLLSLMMIAGTSAWIASAAVEALFAIRPHGGMNVALCGLSDICTAGNLELWVQVQHQNSQVHCLGK